MPNLHVYPSRIPLALIGVAACFVLVYWGLTGQVKQRKDALVRAFDETDRKGNRRPAGEEGERQKALEKVCGTIARANGVGEEELEGPYYWYCIDPETKEEVSYQKVEEGAEVIGCRIYRFADGGCTFEREVKGE